MKKIITFALFLVVLALLTVSGCSTRRVVVVQKSSPPPPAAKNPAAKNYGQTVASQKHVNNGVKHLNRGNYAKAAKEFNKAIAADPNNWEAHYYLGLTYHRWKRYHESVNSYRAAIDLNRNDNRWVSKVRFNIGLALEYAGKYEEARNEYKLAVTLNPENRDAYNRLEKLKAKKKLQKEQKKDDKKKYSSEDKPGVSDD
ncbi:MAG TPA: tetratricopeptide repeat protein [candidate division Zixibacteria bacterium]|nr:tetratricopeptide repeat protein [candidate division Zixibacteria bacterium]